MAVKLISIRKFADMVGCSEGNVRAAIKSGKIVDGVVKDGDKVKGINVTVALQEWSSNLNTDRIRNDEQFARLSGKQPAASATKQAKPRFTPDAESAMDWKMLEGMVSDQPVTVSDDMDITEARRVVMVLQAKLLNLQVQEKEGKLVDAVKTKKALFDAGAEIRKAISLVPGSCIDNILSAETRIDALTILTNEINQALEAITNVNNRFENFNTTTIDE